MAVPVAGVAGGHFAQRREEAEGQAKPVRVETSADDLLCDGREPGEFRELLLHLLFGFGEFLCVGVKGTEDEDADGTAEEFIAVCGEEAAGVLMQTHHVEGAPDDDGVVAFEAGNFGDGLRVDGEALFEEVVGDGVGDFFGGSVTSGPGDEHSGWHGNLRRAVKLRGGSEVDTARRRKDVTERGRLSVSRVTGGRVTGASGVRRFRQRADIGCIGGRSRGCDRRASP